MTEVNQHESYLPKQMETIKLKTTFKRRDKAWAISTVFQTVSLFSFAWKDLEAHLNHQEGV